MWSPRVRRGPRKPFGLNALSVTRTPGKKATRPCPCGYLGDPSGRCRCSESRLLSYRSRISGPLLDRIDIHIEVPRPDAEAMANARLRGEPSAIVAERVLRARELQMSRAGRPNAHLTTREVEDTSNASPEAEQLIRRAMSALGLSARAYHRLLRVARTIADLDGGGAITLQHAGEAIQLRRGSGSGIEQRQR